MLSREEKIQLILLEEEKLQRVRENSWLQWFPDTGEFRRELYPKHMKAFTDTNHPNEVTEVAFIAANRIGKTIVGVYCVKCWMTGIYPKWWPGRVFDEPTNGYCAGDTGETVRDILQLELLGEPGQYGTGMLPAESIIKITPKSGIPDAVKDIYVRHEPSGGTSHAVLKSYDQKRKAFQGTSKDWILNDEEPPLDVYTEELLRLMTLNGVLFNSFTPLSGLSEVVLSFFPGGKI